MRTDMIGRRRTLATSVVAALIAIGALAQAACSSNSDPKPADAAAPIPVTVANVTMTDLADTFEAGGVVQARTTATVTARILAPVREVRARPGDRVRAGQLLIVLDGRDLGANARGARSAALAAGQGATAAAAEQQAAEAALALARAAHGRNAALQI